MQHIRPSTFDAEAFGVPFYRVHEIEPASIRAELEALRAREPIVIVDAKLAADQVEHARLLASLGFRKVCMQITLAHDLAAASDAPSGAEVASRLDLPDAAVQQHAENFIFDRFSLDPLLPRDGIRRLYANWIRNSLTGGRKQIVHQGLNFCTLGVANSTAAIDLVSVVDRGKGIGRALVAGAIRRAREESAKELLVTTECENTPAWNLYLRTGFRPARFTAAFHLVLQ